MPIIAITREMGSLGRDVARALGAELNVPVVYHEVIDHLADRMRVRKSHVIRRLDGSAGLLERLTRSPQFAETMHARLKLADLALTASTDQMLAVAEVASAVSGVRDVVYRTHPGEELRPRFH